MKNDPLKPDAALLCKLGSIIVHADELLSPDGRKLDEMIIKDLLKDQSILDWIQSMHKMAMLPVKRRS